MGHEKRLIQGQLLSRGMDTCDVPEAYEALGLIDRKEVMHPVGEVRGDHRRIISEPVDNRRVQPPAKLLEGLRKLPVKESDIRLDAGGQELVDQPVVEAKSLLGHRPEPQGQDPRPVDGEAVGSDAHLLHECDVIGKAVVMITPILREIPVLHLPRGVREHVPDRGTLVPLVDAALDLNGACCGAPDKIFGKSHIKILSGKQNPVRACCQICIVRTQYKESIP